MAREFLSRHRIAYEALDVADHPMGAEATLALVRSRRTCHVRLKASVLTWDQQDAPVTEERLREYFVHEDGNIRVPVLVAGEAVVRGFDEETYRRVLRL